MDELRPCENDPVRGFSARALIIGAFGSIVITASSLFVALKMGALPWPITFATLVSVAFLRLCKSKNLHEANVCHAAMSAGAMVAGGLAFTLPGLWILGVHTQNSSELSFYQILCAALCGTIIGLVISATLQPFFIRKKRIAYPIGFSAAQTLLATNKTEGKDAKVLFGTMGLSGVFAFLRDNCGFMPTVWNAGAIAPGVTLGIMNSPMMIAVGFIIGAIPAYVWFLGAVFSLVGIGIILPTANLISVDDISGWQVSLGLGFMLAAGAGTVVTNVISAVIEPIRTQKTYEKQSNLIQKRTVSSREDKKALHMPFKWGALLVALVVAIVCVVLQLPIFASFLLILGAWFCGYLSAWLTGTSGVNPMEIFGVLVLLLVQLFFHDLSLVSLFLGAAIVSVACGMVGDVMNDLKAGDELNTDPRDQYLGMVVGGIIGAFVASVMLFILFKAYGSEAFGPQSFFVAAQASAVATMSGGIPVLPVFVVGIIAGFLLAFCKFPVMTFGLGIYLPFYMSAAVFAGALIHTVLKRRNKVRQVSKEKVECKENMYIAAASGILGGESLVGVITALIAVMAAMYP